jgi:hypothetical protein
MHIKTAGILLDQVYHEWSEKKDYNHLRVQFKDAVNCSDYIGLVTDA